LTDHHAYHDLPVAWNQLGSSSIDVLGSYINSINQTNISGKPLTVTEWQHVFSNPYRYEGGLMFPSYARLQGWSAITQHSQAVRLKSEAALSTVIANDPIARASEYMSALLFGRADVAESTHRAEIVVNAA